MGTGLARALQVTLIESALAFVGGIAAPRFRGTSITSQVAFVWCDTLRAAAELALVGGVRGGYATTKALVWLKWI